LVPVERSGLSQSFRFYRLKSHYSKVVEKSIFLKGSFDNEIPQCYRENRLVGEGFWCHGMGLVAALVAKKQ
jgi:hypothetical protein